jgi:hypothetical protein
VDRGDDTAEWAAVAVRGEQRTGQASQTSGLRVDQMRSRSDHIGET